MTKERYDCFVNVIQSRYNNIFKLKLRDGIELLKSWILGSANTSIADYVWLPIRFEGEKLLIDWRDERQINVA